jgi:hypothetical protein
LPDWQVLRTFQGFNDQEPSNLCERSAVATRLAAVVVTSVIMWAFMIAFGFYRVRRYRAGTLEREALASMRIAHARRTGDLRVLEAAVAAGGREGPGESP